MDKVTSIRNQFASDSEYDLELNQRLAIFTGSKLLCFHPATADQIRRIITQSPGKSCDHDPLPTWSLKDCLEELLPIIVQIVNRSLLTAQFPTDLKCALVRPLLKKAKLDQEVFKNNYRERARARAKARERERERERWRHCIIPRSDTFFRKLPLQPVSRHLFSKSEVSIFLSCLSFLQHRSLQTKLLRSFFSETDMQVSKWMYLFDNWFLTQKSMMVEQNWCNYEIYKHVSLEFSLGNGAVNTLASL